MNPDRRAPGRPHRLVIPALGGREPAWARSLELDDIAPWVVATVRAWPRSIEDRWVAVRIGVQPQHVQLARKVRP